MRRLDMEKKENDDLLKALAENANNLNEYTKYLQRSRSGYHFVQKHLLKDLARQLGLLKSIQLARGQSVPSEHECYENVQFLKSFMDNLDWFYEEMNGRFVEYQAEQCRELFEQVERYELTRKQMESAVVEERNNLLIAGAGTGKTSSLIARVAYLIQQGKATEDQILLLAYNKSAAEELRERIAQLTGYSVKVKTFHALGLEIVHTAEPESPSAVLEETADKLQRVRLIQRLVKEAAVDPKMLKLMLGFFMNQLKEYRDSFSFKSQAEYLEYLKTQDTRSFCGEPVKSRGELVIANYLFRQGIRYQYEAGYPHRTELDGRRQYQPDFTIHLPDGDDERQVFIEFWGVDKANQPAPYIDAEHYRRGMELKRKVHREQGTKLIELFHYQLQENQLETELAKELAREGVILNARADLDVFQDLEKKEELNKKSLITNFAELISEMLGHYRANGYTPQDLMARAGQLFEGERLQRAEVFIRIFYEISQRYERYLEEKQGIDFDEMVSRSTKYVREGRYTSSFTHILVDEFQDISEARAGLVKALRDQVPESCLFCVGDDWQAVYQFAGSDINLMTDFERHFGNAYLCVLDRTFRFNNKIADISGRFVMQNPRQISKTITPHAQVDAARVFFATHEKDGEEEAVLKILERIDNLREQEQESVLILCRYNEKTKKINAKRIEQRSPVALKVRFQTVHKSKGGEADHVILRQLSKGRLGFPSGMTTDSLMDLVLARPDSFEQAEERRLFYVALTRARNTVHLLGPEVRQSEFVDELLDADLDPKYEVETIELDGPRPVLRNCPECESGQLLKRDGRNGEFYGCSNYPYCENTEPVPKQKNKLK